MEPSIQSSFASKEPLDVKTDFNHGQEIAAEVLRELSRNSAADPTEVAHRVSKRLDAPLRDCIEACEALIRVTSERDSHPLAPGRMARKRDPQHRRRVDVSRIAPGRRPISHPTRDSVIGMTPGKRTLTMRLSAERDSPIADSIQSVARALGIDPDRVQIDDGVSGARRANAHRSLGVAIDGAIFVDSSKFDFDSRSGLGILAHELTHVAQQRMPGSSRQLAAAEKEAHDSERAVLSGAMPTRPRVSLASNLAAAYGGPEEAEKKPDETGPGFQVSPDGNALRIKKWWYDKHFKGGKTNATAMMEVLESLAAGPMPWISKLTAKERADAAAVLSITASFKEGKEESLVNIRTSVYAHVGLPPGVSFQWDYPVAQKGKDGEPSKRVAQCVVRLSELVPNVGGSGAQASGELVRQVLGRLESDVGLTANGVIKADLIRSRRISAVIKSGTQSAIFLYRRGDLVALFGEDKWLEYEQKAGSDPSQSTGKEGKGSSFDEGLSKEDIDFATAFLKRIAGAGGGKDGGTALYVGSTLVSVMREIDEHPKADEIIARLKGETGAAPPKSSSDRKPLDTVSKMRNAIHAVAMSENYERLGLEEPNGEAKSRPFRFPVEGSILNHGDLLFIGKEAEFSFRTSSNNDHLGIPWVYVRWIVTRVSGPGAAGQTVDSDWTRHRDYAHEPPDRYEIEFDKPGIYEVNAIVDHRFYLQNAFSIQVEVKTEDERLGELEERAYGGGQFGTVDGSDDSYEFPDTSWTDSEAKSTGRVLEGRLPTECREGEPLPPDTMDRLREQKDRIQKYLESGRADPRNTRYAAEYLESLKATERKIEKERKDGAKPLAINGVYLSRTSNAKSQQLTLIAHAKQTDGEWDVVIHDTTQAFDSENSRISASAGTFRGALEEAFVDLCKGYPTGQMSIRCESLDDEQNSTGKWIGFELDCNSTWESIRSTVWDPTVQIVINIAGAVTVIFVPATAPVVLPALIAYNATEEISKMADYYERGTLSTKKAMMGLGSIAIDVIPYVGQAGKLIKLGGRAYHIMNGLEIGGELLLMNAEAIGGVQAIRMGKVREAAQLSGQIDKISAENESDPNLPRLRSELEKVQGEARDAWADTYAKIAATQGMMRLPQTAARQLHAIRTHRQDTADAAMGTAVKDRGDDAMTDADSTLVADSFGLPVSRIEGGDVRISFSVGKFGSIKNIKLEVGKSASLKTVEMHRQTLHAMQKYEGTAGKLHSVLQRVDAFTKGRAKPLSPSDGRAFEAHHELNKLVGMIETFKGEIAGGKLDAGSVAKINREIDALQSQIEHHAADLNVLAPGLGHVASKGDDDGKMTKMGDSNAGSSTLEGGANPSWDTRSVPDDVRAELYELRNTLSPEVQAHFDGFIASKGDPTVAKIELDGMKASKDGLEGSLARHLSGDSLERSSFTTKNRDGSEGVDVEVVVEGEVVVPTGKVERYIRGKSIPFNADRKQELRDLKKKRQTARKEFDKDPENAKRITKLEKLKHNYERSVDMAGRLDESGLTDTPANNDVIIGHLLVVGRDVSAAKTIDVRSELEGPEGRVKILSTWKILPDDRKYLTTIKVIPMKEED